MSEISQKLLDVLQEELTWVEAKYGKQNSERTAGDFICLAQYYLHRAQLEVGLNETDALRKATTMLILACERADVLGRKAQLKAWRAANDGI